MAHGFSATTTINRPIDQVFAFLADGTNDTKFSPRVQEIKKLTDGPPGVGTVYSSAVKDAGLKSSRQFKLTEFEQPTRIRWTELSKNAITVSDDGYDLEPAGDGGDAHDDLELLQGPRLRHGSPPARYTRGEE